jgi:hypothetical protein
MFQIGGIGPSNTTETLRNHRWLITQLGPTKGLAILAKDLQLPDLSILQQEIMPGQNTYKYAKGTKWSDIQVVFYDDGKILEQINNWRARIYSAGTGIKSHALSFGYKQTCVFHLLSGCTKTTESGINSVNVIILIGAWPSNISLGRLSYTDSKIKEITLTLSYDYAQLGDIDDQSGSNEIKYGDV